MLVSDAISRFKRILAAEGKAPGTITSYVKSVSIFLEDMGIDDTDELTRESVQDYFLDLSHIQKADHTDLATSTINSIKSSVKHFLQITLFWPAADIQIPRTKIVHQKPPCFSERDRDILLDGARNYIPTPSVRSRTVPPHELTLIRLRLQAMILLGFDCGLRISEVLNLSFENVDPSRGYVHIINSKRHKSRTLRYSATTRDALNAYVSHAFNKPFPKSGYVFPGKKEGHFLSSGTAGKYFRDLLFRCGYDKSFHFHSLRHGFTSWHANHGTSPYDVAHLLGHSSLATSMHYYHWSESRIDSLPTPCEGKK